SIRDSSAACRCSMARPPLMRPAPTRVATYCSKLLLKVPRWRRSKLSTPMSCCTPPSACEITPCETPALAASADMLATKLLKSPPQRAASAEPVARQAATMTGRRYFNMHNPFDSDLDHATGPIRGRGPPARDMTDVDPDQQRFRLPLL